MGTYIARRLLQSTGVVIGVTLISFIALQAGGDPTYLFVSERATTEEIAVVRHALGFDRPLHVQYLSFVGGLARGDFGQSLSYRQPALDLVLDLRPETTLFQKQFQSGRSTPSLRAERNHLGSALTPEKDVVPIVEKNPDP